MAIVGMSILYTLILWWVSTIVILYLDGLHPRTFVWSMTGATILALVAFAGLLAISADTSEVGAYHAFTCGLVAWGWQITSFYMGFITGPRKTPCDPRCVGWPRFFAAVRTCSHHEIAITAMAVAMLVIVWKQPNQFGLWTFLVLWWMHASAKLNVFFGVPNLGAEFIPRHMSYLVSFMTRKPMNIFFPVSVTVSTVVTVMFAEKAAATSASPFETAGYTMLSTLMALAILEHWFLVTPLDANALWKWGVKDTNDTKTPDAVAHARPSDARTSLSPSRKQAVSFKSGLDHSSSDSAETSDYSQPSGASNGALESWCTNPPSICDHAVLMRLLDAIGAGAFGEVQCVKGIVKTKATWIQFDADSRRANVAPFAPKQRLDPLVFALGRRLDRVRLQAAFDACSAAG